MKSKQYPYEVYVLRKRVNNFRKEDNATQMIESTFSVWIAKC